MVDFNDRGFIDPEIKPYVDKFIHEAEVRGYYFDVSNIKIVFGKPSKGASATTYFTSKKIVIKKNSSGWLMYPESLVFHELGHLLLKRDHNNETIGGFYAYPKSIMISSEAPIFTGVHAYRREYYVNELFNPYVNTPSWLD